jgi:hypothetical protein
MPGMFDDERRRNGGFARGPFGVGPKSSLKASKSAGRMPRYALRFFPVQERFQAPTQTTVNSWMGSQAAEMASRPAVSTRSETSRRPWIAA